MTRDSGQSATASRPFDLVAADHLLSEASGSGRCSTRSGSAELEPRTELGAPDERRAPLDSRWTIASERSIPTWRTKLRDRGQSTPDVETTDAARTVRRALYARTGRNPDPANRAASAQVGRSGIIDAPHSLPPEGRGSSGDAPGRCARRSQPQPAQMPGSSAPPAKVSQRSAGRWASKSFRRSCMECLLKITRV
jgi:hypothetical protein